MLVSFKSDTKAAALDNKDLDDDIWEIKWEHSFTKKSEDV